MYIIKSLFYYNLVIKKLNIKGFVMYVFLDSLLNTKYKCTKFWSKTLTYKTNSYSLKYMPRT